MTNLQLNKNYTSPSKSKLDVPDLMIELVFFFLFWKIWDSEINML